MGRDSLLTKLGGWSHKKKKKCPWSSPIISKQINTGIPFPKNVHKKKKSKTISLQAYIYIYVERERERETKESTTSLESHSIQTCLQFFLQSKNNRNTFCIQGAMDTKISGKETQNKTMMIPKNTSTTAWRTPNRKVMVNCHQASGEWQFQNKTMIVQLYIPMPEIKYPSRIYKSFLFPKWKTLCRKIYCPAIHIFMYNLSLLIYNLWVLSLNLISIFLRKNEIWLIGVKKAWYCNSNF